MNITIASLQVSGVRGLVRRDGEPWSHSNDRTDVLARGVLTFFGT